MLIGISMPYRKKGLDAVFYYRSIQKAKEAGYHTAELSWVAESNLPMNILLEKMEAERYRTYRVYEKLISENS